MRLVRSASSIEVPVTQLTEADPAHYHVEASDLGLQPGEFPEFIRVTRGPTSVIRFIRPTRIPNPEVVIYTCGSLELHVLND